MFKSEKNFVQSKVFFAFFIKIQFFMNKINVFLLKKKDKIQPLNRIVKLWKKTQEKDGIFLNFFYLFFCV